MTGKKIYTPTDYKEKQMQRALLQFRRPQNRAIVREALRRCGREDLIGNSPDCLVPPEKTGENPGKGDRGTVLPSRRKNQRSFNKGEKDNRTSASGSNRNNNTNRGKKNTASVSKPKNSINQRKKNTSSGSAPKNGGNKKHANPSNPNKRKKRSNKKTAE